MFVNRTSFIKIVNTRREIIHLQYVAFLAAAFFHFSFSFSFRTRPAKRFLILIILKLWKIEEFLVDWEAGLDC